MTGTVVSTGTDVTLEDAYKDVTKAFEVVEKRISVATGEESLVIRVNAPGNKIPFEIPRELLSKRTFFGKLVLHGLSVVETDDAYEVLREALDEVEKSARVVYVHEQTGFREVCDHMAFFAYNSIAENEATLPVSVNPSQAKALKPTGSLHEWQRFIRKHIADHPQRALALILGATAPVAYILKERAVFPEVPLWAIIGTTSTGKTTLLHLIASMYANPTLFIENLNTTSNALNAMLEEKSGYPLLCDEATHTPNIAWDTLIYALPTGKEKRRCDSSGKLKAPITYGGAMILTSETSILERTQGYGGEECRLLEFQLSCFDTDPELPSQIRRFCSSNYGWITQPLAKLLLDDSFVELLISRYDLAVKRLTRRFREASLTGVKHRVIQRLALILVSGWVLKQAAQCNFDLSAIEDLLVSMFDSQVRGTRDKSKAEDIIYKIAGFVSSHREMFPSVETLESSGRRRHFSAFWGATGYHGLHRCVWVNANIFQNRVCVREMANRNKMLNQLESCGYIVKFYNKTFSIHKSFAGLPGKYYCFLLPGEENLLKKLDTATDSVSVGSLNACIGDDPDVPAYGYLNSEKSIATVSIAHSAFNSYYIVLNKEFLKNFGTNTHGRLYVTPIAKAKHLLLSKKRVAQNTSPMQLYPHGDEAIAKGPMMIKIVAALGLNIPEAQRLTTNAVDFGTHQNESIAGIDFNYENAYFRPTDYEVIDTVWKPLNDEIKYTQIPSLLSEEEP